MGKVFSDLLLASWWGWVGLVAFLVSLTLAFGGGYSDQDRAWCAVAAFLFLTIFLGPVVLRAARNGPQSVPTVCVWTGAWLLVGLAAFFAWYFSWAAANPGGNADRILNIVPAMTAIVAAGLGWYVHYQFTARTQRINASFALIMEWMKSSEYLKYSQLVSHHFPSRLPEAINDYREYFPPGIKREILQKARQNNVEPDEEELEKADAIIALRYVLNFYEFMAAGVRSNDLDRDLLQSTFAEVVIGRFERSMPLIEYCRTRGGTGGKEQVLAFEHLEIIVRDWSHKVEDEVTAKKRNGQ